MAAKIVSLYCGRCRTTTSHTQAAPAHVLHAVLTLVTSGLWALAWIYAATCQRPLTCGRCGGGHDHAAAPPPTAPTASGEVACGFCGAPAQLDPARRAWDCSACGASLSADV